MLDMSELWWASYRKYIMMFLILCNLVRVGDSGKGKRYGGLLCVVLLRFPKT